MPPATSLISSILLGDMGGQEVGDWDRHSLKQGRKTILKKAWQAAGGSMVKAATPTTGEMRRKAWHGGRQAHLRPHSTMKNKRRPSLLSLLTSIFLPGAFSSYLLLERETHHLSTLWGSAI